MTVPIGLTYEERQALPVIRKLLKRKPELITLLLEGTTKEAASKLLIGVRDELEMLLRMNRAFSAAAAELAKKLEVSNESQSI